eukprot:3708271-Amphidinium_carterae.1
MDPNRWVVRFFLLTQLTDGLELCFCKAPLSSPLLPLGSSQSLSIRRVLRVRDGRQQGGITFATLQELLFVCTAFLDPKNQQSHLPFQSHRAQAAGRVDGSSGASFPCSSHDGHAN